jgi:hypothetical protein
MNGSIPELLAVTLAELGLPAPCDVHQTMFVKDCHFVGHKFRYEGGYAILHAGGNTLAFYDEQGRLLKAVALESEKGTAA